MKNYIIKYNELSNTTEYSIMNSSILGEIIDSILDSVKRVKKDLYNSLTQSFNSDNLKDELIKFYKRLLNERYLDLMDEYLPFSSNKKDVLYILEEMYDLWRKKERYSICDNTVSYVSSSEFMEYMNRFEYSIIKTYRKILENILSSSQTVYRQLPSGLNAGFIINEYNNYKLPSSLEFLKETKVLDTLVIKPPFVLTSTENTRVGKFYSDDDKISSDKYNSNDYILVNIMVNERLGLIYIHKDYLSFLVALGNLFKIVKPSEINTDPSFIVIFGYDNNKELTYYYKENDLYIGVVPLNGHIGYFGYLKKIILTLFNLIEIDNNNLPIHGAGVNIIMNNSKEYNIVILGDSGAGKSETLETLKRIGLDKVAHINTIFDDMGTFRLINNKVYATGTEIGAFIRLDDLDHAFGINSMDRAVYINTNRTNSRIVLPVSSYHKTKELFKVDMFLVADNYTNTNQGIIKYTDKDKAINDFIKGERVAKGTTNELGLVSTFFSNPFGPMQRENDSRIIINNIFDNLFNNNIYIGRIYTKLSLDPYRGPIDAANKLLEILNNGLDN